MADKEISRATLKRLPTYLSYLKSMPADSPANISATALAAALHMGEVQVRKDLAMVSDGGRPKIGYRRESLIRDIEGFLGYGNTNDAVLIGAGKLMHLSRLHDVCVKHQIRIGIITVPAEHAQKVCDLLIENGIRAIWNFAPKHLDVPDDILVQNENMAASLALLSKHLSDRMKNQE